MKPHLYLLAGIVSLLLGSATAAEKPTLLGLQIEHEKATTYLQKDLAERIAKLQHSYRDALTKLQAEKQAEGDLDSALAVKNELDSPMEKALSKAEMAALRPEVSALRRKFDRAFIKLQSDASKVEVRLLNGHAEQLLALQEQLTKDGELQTAVEIRELRSAALKRAKELEAGEAAVAAVRANDGGARPEPGPGPGQEPEPETPLTPTEAKLTLVATKVQGKGSVEGAAPSVIVFDGPTGDGRRGAKGILVKAASDGSRLGSTWSMEYTRARSARGLQIIHPRGNGHAIVHILNKGVGISTPGEWIKVGYVGGSGDGVRKKKGFDEIFPLKDEQVYSIVSRMAGNGSCEVFINGILVATANVRSAKPLSLVIPEGEKFPRSSTWDKLAFKGDGLPLQWEKNWAGLIVEPLDSGMNICRNVRYTHGIAEVPGNK